MKPVHLMPREVRGIVSVRSDASSAAMLRELHTAFDEFKATMDQRTTDQDVVLAEKEARINTALDEIQAALDRQNTELAQLKLGGRGEPGSPVTAEAKAHQQAWAIYMRTGAGEQELHQLGIARNDVHANIIRNIQAAGSAGAPDKGGFLAPVEWDRTITSARKDIAPMRQYASQQNVSGQGFSKLYNMHGAGSGWVGEDDERPETNSPNLKSYAFAFGEIYANPSATQTILDDSEIDFAQWLAGEVETEFAAQEGVAFLTGNGTNKPRGLLTFDAATEGALAANLRHPLGPIAEVNSGAATGLTTDGLIDVQYDLPSSRSQGAAFFMNRKTMGAVRKLKDGEGNLIWAPTLAADQPSTLLGSPCRELDGMPDVAAAAIPVFYGNMEMVYRIFDRVGIRILRDPYTSKPYVLFYTTKRVGGGLWNPEWGRYLRIGVDE